MVLTAKGVRTRERIIDGTAAYLRSEEPGGVTLDDIRAATKTSKSQIFHYFPGGKEELFLEAAKREADRVIEDQQPHLSALDSWAAWGRWRDAVIERYRAQGQQCPLGVLMSQLGDVPGASEVITALVRRWQSELERGIETMQSAGKVRARLNPERTAAAMIAGIQGGVVVLRTTGRTDHLEAALDTLIEHLRD